MPSRVATQAGERAGGVCEYCHSPRSHSVAPFQVDHIIAKKHGGGSDLANLAYCCYHCNLHKGPNLTGIDPKTGVLCRLFSPRKDAWTDHFRWDEPLIAGRTPVGRATVKTLAMNEPLAVELRTMLLDEGVVFV